MRVLYVLWQFPQISQTYVHSELDALKPHYECRVVATADAPLPPRRHHPFERIPNVDRLNQIIAEFKPQILHTHYISNAALLAGLSAQWRIPYTIRAHSFDVIERPRSQPFNEYCLGVLTFPFLRPALLQAGIPAGKLTDCYPVVDVGRFDNRAPNGTAVLNFGACRPKKRFEDYIDLAALMPEQTFNLHPLSYDAEKLITYNASKGSLAHLQPPVQPEDMPALYKRHGWLVYTACPKLKSVGWPMAIAEAQASGLGVCMPNIRPDLAEYLGGAGYLYDDIRELPDIISKPVPADMRERGFEQAKKSDVRKHIHLLTDLWHKAVSA